MSTKPNSTQPKPKVGGAKTTATQPKPAQPKARAPKAKPLAPNYSPARAAITVRQERFCQRVAAGMPAYRAYQDAGYDGTGNVAGAASSRMLKDVKISLRIADIMRPDEKKLVVTKDRKRQLLRQKIESGEFKPADWLRAIEIDAKLAGDFAPERMEVEQGPKTLESIRTRATEVSAALDRNARLKSRQLTASPESMPTGLSRWSPP